ncbi:MAG: universal stress protein [Desulforegulaceae bacterium]|nr:universal stress protein [Desulforegulaceae bacterium]
MFRPVKKILYATDLSEAAREAMKYAISLSSQYGAHMTTIHVVPNVFEELSLSTGVEMELYFGFDKWKEMETERFENAKRAVKERIDQTSKEMEPYIKNTDNISFSDIIVKIGHPVTEILKTADEEEADLLVMATHGHGRIEELLVGSVSRGVLRKSKIPVVLVPLKKA